MENEIDFLISNWNSKEFGRLHMANFNRKYPNYSYYKIKKNCPTKFLKVGKKPKPSKFLSFDEARKVVHQLKLKSLKEWRKYCDSDNMVNNISCSPQAYYKNSGWKGWSNWLGVKLY
jgi:hypothetical protein